MAGTANNNGANSDQRWLVLVHQFPQDPGSLRVRIWRRLQAVGAVAIRNSLYALPLNEQTHEDFQWILGEILAGGADGALLESRFIDGMDDRQVRRLFDVARNADYDALADEARTLRKQLADRQEDEEDLNDARTQLAKLRKKFTAIEKIDFFGADRREAAFGLLATIEQRIAESADKPDTRMDEMNRLSLDEMQGRVWVTRSNVGVDRIASAWLIRRYVDPQVVFKFTSSKNYSPSRREVRFDMFDAEFTHEGEKCTFEVLLTRGDFADAALVRIAQVVHDIDLKDGKYGHEETAGIAMLLAGISAGGADDDQRIDRGCQLFDDLYRSLLAAQE